MCEFGSRLYFAQEVMVMWSFHQSTTPHDLLALASRGAFALPYGDMLPIGNCVNMLELGISRPKRHHKVTFNFLVPRQLHDVASTSRHRYIFWVSAATSKAKRLPVCLQVSCKDLERAHRHCSGFFQPKHYPVDLA